MADKIEVSRVHMCNGRILAQQLAPKELSDGGIALADDAKRPRAVARVVATRPGCEISGIPLRPGALIMTSRHAMESYAAEEFEGERLFVVNEKDILCIIEPETKGWDTST